MTLEEAVAIVAEVCAAFQGNLAQHQRIQQALEVVRAALPQDTDE